MYEKELQRVNVNILQKCKECMCNRDISNICCNLGGGLFMIFWPVNFSIALQMQKHSERPDVKSMPLFHWTS
jgi:hypothetical protein